MKRLLFEGRYDSLVTKLSNKLLSVIKDSYKATTTRNGKFNKQKIYFKSNEVVPEILDDNIQPPIFATEVVNNDIPMEFNLQLKVQWIENFNDFRVGGDAFNDTNIDVNETPLIEIRFKIDPAEYPNILSEIAMELRDVLRHEIEHLTQGGWNTKNGKFIRSDQGMRAKIDAGIVPVARYFMLPKEVDANIHGLYLRAKKSRKPFADIVNDYLNIWVNNGAITTKNKLEILNVWRKRLPALGIRQEL